ncbi:methyltransferase domain-containing protein [Rapidithrix thailandica]|uniref:Methyltransferase domain-containing protein n=1 Tax=Rapidithrix thailandica TaxID=413964 RepID=A0AAW9SAE3_9BACT
MPKDNFSVNSGLYARYRPLYPDALFEFILAHTPVRKQAWDCATGNGQCAAVLSKYFASVKATDISQKQLSHALYKPNIDYSVASAENSGFAPRSFNLITVAQAAHWFELSEFYQEVQRVACRDATLAIWGYGLVRISQAIDPIIREFYTQTVAPYWDPERKHLDNGYQNISMPFNMIPAPEFTLDVHWNLAHFTGYLNTWSSVRKFIQEKQYNPVEHLIRQLSLLWPPHEIKTLSFPIFLKLGKVH